VHFSLAHLAALGLLVPIIAAAWPSRGYETTLPPAWIILATTATLSVLHMVTANWTRHPALRRFQQALTALAIICGLLAPVLAALMNNDRRWVYSNFGVLIAANAFIALVAINLLSLFHWLAVRAPARDRSNDRHWTQTGRVATFDESRPVGCVRCS